MNTPSESLNTIVQGSGDTVLLLHSGGMSGRQRRRLGERLAADFRVVMPDLLGSGANPPWPDERPFELTLDLDAVNALVDGPFHVVGHSYGGLLALRLARARPQDVRSMALYDPVAFGVLHAANDAEGLADLAAVGSLPVFTDDALGGREPWMRAFVDYWNGPGSWDAMPPPGREAFLRVGRKVYYEVRSLMDERSAAESYAVIQAPTLLIRGEKTPLAARRVQHVLAAALPHAREVVIDGAGHMGPITHAEAVNALIVEHIQHAR